MTAGWATPAAIYLLDALIAAAVAVLAFNDWHAMRIRVRTVAVFAFVAGTCVFFGYAYY